MSEKFTTSIITSNIISPPPSQTNSNEIVQDEDDGNLANGGWEDDYTDNEEDAENMKEWETLEFLCQISKTRSNDDYNKDGDSDVKNGILDFDSKFDEDSNLEKGDENDDGDGSNGGAAKRIRMEKKVKDNENSKSSENNKNSENSMYGKNIENIENSRQSENNENNENNGNNKNSKNSEIKPDMIAPLADSIEQPSSPHQSNIGNKKRKASDDDKEIDVATLFQKPKKQKDGLET